MLYFSAAFLPVGQGRPPSFFPSLPFSLRYGGSGNGRLWSQGNDDLFPSYDLPFDPLCLAPRGEGAVRVDSANGDFPPRA